jgi:putative transposase
MRQARIKVDAGAGVAVYHCMTRTVNGERLFDDVAKEVLRKQLWTVARFCGVEVVTYAIMSNHFHVLVRVPQRAEVSDAELLMRYGILYPKPTKFQTARLEVIRSQLATNGEEAVAWRRRQLLLMGDVSPFMKLLKQRFSVWFNRSHQRYGTLWSERFKSVLVEPKHHACRTIAAYIDLNPVRAGLVSDPKDYRFCGYAEALAGNATAQQGLISVVEAKGWTQAQESYRQTLFGTGAGAREHANTLSIEQFQQVVKQKGRLPLASVLRHRVRYFTDGAVLGSRAFVRAHLADYRRRSGGGSRSSPRPIPPITDWGDLATLRGLRQKTFG